MQKKRLKKKSKLVGTAPKGTGRVKRKDSAGEALA